MEEFKLYFRRLQQGQQHSDHDNSLEQSQPLQHQSIQLHSIHRGYAGGSYMSYQRGDWRDVVLPAMPLSHDYTQGMSYMIRNLEPDQQYEVRVQAK